MNHEDDYSDENMKDVEKAVDDFTNRWYKKNNRGNRKSP